MVSSKRGALSRRAARLQGEAVVRAVAVKAEAVLVPELVLEQVADLVLVRVPDLVAVEVADLVAVLLQWLPAR